MRSPARPSYARPGVAWGADESAVANKGRCRTKKPRTCGVGSTPSRKARLGSDSGENFVKRKIVRRHVKKGRHRFTDGALMASNATLFHGRIFDLLIRRQRMGAVRGRRCHLMIDIWAS